jgi:nucleoside-diphosphate-sugar epimerase
MSERPIREPIVVTGATGFIGRRLLRRLLDEGYHPRALVLPGDPVPIEWGDRVEVVEGDVSKAAQVARGLEGASTVIHLAAVVGDWGEEELHRRVTVRGTDNVLTEAARQRAHAVLISSVVVYGDRAGRIICHEGQPMGRALGPYSRAKQEQERIAQHLEEQRSLKVTIVRPTNVFGPGSIWVDQAVEQLKAGLPCLIGGGRMCAGLTYVDNVVELVLLAAGTPAAVGRCYNANDDNGVTWLRYFTELAELAGTPPPKTIPKIAATLGAVGAESAWRLLKKEGRPPLTREALNLVGSDLRVPIDKARQELGYVPRVSFAEGMKEVARYLATTN